MFRILESCALSGNSARCALRGELNKRWNYIVPVLNRYMDELSATKYAAKYYTGVLQDLNKIVCKAAIDRNIDLSVEQLELIKEISHNAIKHAREHANSSGDLHGRY